MAPLPTSLPGSHADKHNDRNQGPAGRAILETRGSAPTPASVDCGGVPPPDTTRQQALNSRLKSLLLLIFVSVLAVFFGGRSLVLLQGADFPHFYCAARMLADGLGSQLYDADVQRQYQARYAGRVGTLYTHPPFEAALYLAVAWLPLRYAYLLWSFLSMALTAASAILLTREALSPWSWRVVLVASLTFVPSLVCVIQGQDSLLLLWFVVLAFTALRRGRGFAAGCWLALGLFKFQLVLPLVLVLVLTQRSSRAGLAKGFSLTALALAGVSVAISGWSVLTLYPNFLLHFHEQPLGGIAPGGMANFRGLAYFLFHRDGDHWIIAAVSILSLAALLTTLRGWKHAQKEFRQEPSGNVNYEFDLAFANTVLFALLVSYHLNPHDLALLLLSILLLLHCARVQTQHPPRPAQWMTFSLMGILFLPPLHLWALTARAYDIVGIPVFLLFLTSAVLKLIAPTTSPGKATTIQG